MSGRRTRHLCLLCIKLMGLRKRHQIPGPALFFVTTSTFNHKPLLNTLATRKQILGKLLNTAKDKRIKLMAYVIMPNHLHLMVMAPSGGIQLSGFIHSLKGRIRKDVFGNKKIWQDRFDDLVITSEEQFRIKLDYIHNNPVKAGLIKVNIEWACSSAKACVERQSSFLVFAIAWE